MGRHRRPPGDPDETTRPVVLAPVLSAREVFTRFGSLTRPDRPWLTSAVALLVIAAGCETVAVWMFTDIVDEALAAASPGAFWAPAAVWAAVGLLGAGFTFAGRWLSAWVTERFVLRLRGVVFAHLQRLPPDFFERRRLGDLVARLTGDVDEIEELVSSGVVHAVAAVLSLVVFVGAAFYLQWDLAALALALVALLWLVTRWFAARVKRAARSERDSGGAVGAVVEESLANAALVQAYTAEQTVAARLHAAGRLNLRARMAEARLAASHASVTELFETLGFLTVLGVGAVRIAGGDLTVGELLGFAAYLGFLYPPLKELGELMLTMTSATASSERLAELLDTPPRVRPVARPRRERASRGRLRVEGVDFAYPGTGREVLAGLSLTADPGELVVITGTSGAGKSSVAKLLARFYDPGRGRITLDGVDLREFDLATLRASVTLLLQETLLLDASIADNIGFGSPGATEHDIRAAGALAGVDSFAGVLPDGYATVVGQRGRRLSGGQRQRVAIARAIVRDAPLLVLDEPTAGLDGPTAGSLLRPLRELMRSRTTIMITHDLGLAPDADRILVLDQGRLVEAGSHPELLAARGFYHRLYTDRRDSQVARGRPPAKPPGPSTTLLRWTPSNRATGPASSSSTTSRASSTC